MKIRASERWKSFDEVTQGEEAGRGRANGRAGRNTGSKRGQETSAPEHVSQDSPPSVEGVKIQLARPHTES